MFAAHSFMLISYFSQKHCVTVFAQLPNKRGESCFAAQFSNLNTIPSQESCLPP